MDQTTEPDSVPATSRMRTAAFAVHLFTAMGAGIALLAMLEAVREHWANMFGWLGVALIIDAIDGPIARRLNGASEAPAPHDRIEGLEHLDKVIDIDQSPIGRTPRSNPATYTGAFTQIRDWFAGLPESKARGYKPGRFSFNVKGGRCEACQGDGLIKIEMHFLPDVYVTCDVCKGKRYNRETLDIKYKGASIADVLDMNVEEAAEPHGERLRQWRERRQRRFGPIRRDQAIHRHEGAHQRPVVGCEQRHGRWITRHCGRSPPQRGNDGRPPGNGGARTTCSWRRRTW